MLRCLELSEDDAVTLLRHADKDIGAFLDKCIHQTRTAPEAGWTEYDLLFRIEGKPELEAAFESLGISQALEHRKTTAWTWNSDGMAAEYGVDVVLGAHHAVYVPIDGATPVLEASSPEQERAKLAKRNSLAGEGELPTLRRWSDVAYLAYLKYCQPLSLEASASGLRHIFMHSVINDTSSVIIRRLLQDCGQKVLSCEERRGFPPASDEGRALLGMPSGYGVLWMLLGQPTLRRLTVKSVCLFGRWASGPDGPHLYIELGERTTSKPGQGS